ncbi:V-type ATP synthase subunit E [Marichromatium gracile]|uniref:V-type ATP synthase subunit E n=1 Tax=Marichromatium gracile TaxID=1048 RepID=A0A4R4AAA3_MARGR|nr:V-type ATP synthase subunit E family protein [Marichromatium gracile]MBK1708839.1 ATPase [Marichromatium gracile]MBO8084956.1 ATPase [Marichromatium sp.]TCW35901.1 V/A-type H+-transporting ATPase subunit E [Marichromatium gracile]
MTQVDELEQAILARAERLAAEYRARAASRRDTILREAAERLRAREQHEEQVARALAERSFRQQVQASELKLQTHLDRVRWNLMQAVERGLEERMRAFVAERDTYGDWLATLIVRDAGLIEQPRLRVEANAHDLVLLRERWAAILEALPEGREAELVEEPITALGGVRVSDAEGRVRIDDTHAGRLERLRPEIQRVILERLLPNGLDTANLFNG